MDLLPWPLEAPNLHSVFEVVLIPAALLMGIVALARCRNDLFTLGRSLLGAGLAAALPAFGVAAPAPHGEQAPATDTSAHVEHEETPATDHAHAGHGETSHPAPAENEMAMPSRPLGLPATRDASGTAWQPDLTPMHAIHFMRGDWSLMLHGSGFAGWDEQGTDRGDAELTSVNWIMLMASRPLGRGEFGLRGMFSAEPWTAGDDGYPLLLQSGETAGGEPLHDRQHPHDLFMEVAARYTVPVSKRLAVDLYIAPAGEPALGPIAFPHRASAASDPFAPLGHHWQDATHISFGVLTAGLFGRKWKVEGSWFNGREPDEARADFDLRPPDSWSARVSVNPTERISLQLSTGFLESPEALEPDLSIQRSTASLYLAGPASRDRNWTLTGVWGRNDPSHGGSTDAFLVEADIPLGARETLFGRVEHVEKTGHDLVLDHDLEDEAFDVTSLVLGYVHDFGDWGKWTPSLGARVSANFFDDALKPYYGDDVGYGGMVFFRIRTSAMKHEPRGQHERMPGAR